jgi:hypothetical protein
MVQAVEKASSRRRRYGDNRPNARFLVPIIAGRSFRQAGQQKKRHPRIREVRFSTGCTLLRQLGRTRFLWRFTQEPLSLNPSRNHDFATQPV